MIRALLAFSLLLASTAGATTLKAFTLEDMATHASMIIEGTVVDIQTDWDGRFIFTDVTVEVERCHKGECEVEVVEVRNLGGAVGDLEMSAIGVARFELDEPVLLFLEPIGDVAPGFLRTTGLSQGKFRIEPRLEQVVLKRDPRAARLAGPDIAAAVSLDEIPLNALLDRLDRVLR